MFKERFLVFEGLPKYDVFNDRKEKNENVESKDEVYEENKKELSAEVAESLTSLSPEKIQEELNNFNKLKENLEYKKYKDINKFLGQKELNMNIENLDIEDWEKLKDWTEITEGRLGDIFVSQTKNEEGEVEEKIEFFHSTGKPAPEEEEEVNESLIQEELNNFNKLKEELTFSNYKDINKFLGQKGLNMNIENLNLSNWTKLKNWIDKTEGRFGHLAVIKIDGKEKIEFLPSTGKPAPDADEDLIVGQ